MRRFEEVILDFIGNLERMEIDYVIVGVVAVNSWGTPRTTRDLDAVIVQKAENSYYVNLPRKDSSLLAREKRI